jgi:hypothetical protein
MTFGTSSKIFRQYLADAVGPTSSFTPHLATGGTLKAALYGNTGTPDATVAAASSAYNTGQWVTADELTSSTQWPAGGIALTWASATRFASTSNLVTLDADDTPGGGTVTLASVWGDLVYDDALTTPVAKQGIAFHSFGAAQSVTAGTFTIVWNASGVAQISV